ncbi:M48 family metalloprotease [Reichenbachiella ulvae]|uniref:M48 family metalloprotease n=1 Tax=Reichenbachiella ulvae TaxID=2980104 RepID=A0ABT3D138_9BACT|nr:M48 family metalloprotease [Reichenbachiella ulvae]MCV9389460.1 M48 family metalloprotease [Reichenbachiella ulvae]
MIRFILTGVFLFSCVAVFGQGSTLSDKMGAATFAEVQRSMGIYEDEELLDYVMDIGRRLEEVMPEHDEQFKYFLVDTEDPNAFATAGGYVYVTRGLLALLDTEDELAGVLGHEFSHILLKHSEKKIGRTIFPKVLEIPGNLVGSMFSELLGALMNNPIEVTAKTVNSAFDRSQENHADKSGVELAAAAGFDPKALSSALVKLEFFVQTLTEEESSFHLFDDHPLTKKRVDNLKELTADMSMSDRYVQKSILPAIDGLILGQNPKNGVVLEDNLFLHSDLNISFQLPEGWGSKNTPESLTATDRKSGSGLGLGLDEENESAKAAYKAYAKSLKGQKGLMLTVDKKKEIGGFNAVELLVEDGKSNTTVVTWIEFDGVNGLIQLVGSTSSEEQLNKIQQSISSFRLINEEERARVFTKLLRAEETEASTLSEYAKEKGFDGNIKILEILNGQSADDQLVDQEVKFMEKEPYN